MPKVAWLNPKKQLSTFAQPGTKFVDRAPSQQVSHTDRRGTLIRGCVHRNHHAQFDVDFKHVLGECVFAGNVMLTVNESSSCNVVCGRTPPLASRD